LLRDKQNEKRIASPANVPETSSVASPSVDTEIKRLVAPIFLGKANGGSA
jgi:hypothetical protein